MANVVQVEVSDEMLAKLQRLAQDMKRSVEELCGMALEDFVPAAQEDVDAILEGIRDCEEGRTVSNEEVVAWLMSVGTESPLPRPEPKSEVLSRAS